ncbi:SigE family RNA polymerase sigma factor [Fodinicola feengrottensis]|uniref:RNA polymerase sigma-70 region 2 domain-containing protein n=1 Tax=Fodinicola feengrottensis TaxID=435914 RepID=A0ABP4VJN7_9ACTN|nr:sigma factor [Fodinicola feengrottensis]
MEARVKKDRRSVDAELDEIFRATYRRLVVSMYAVTGDFVEAQDIVADAFVAAVTYRERLLAVASPEAWLRAVAAT